MVSNQIALVGARILVMGLTLKTAQIFVTLKSSI